MARDERVGIENADGEPSSRIAYSGIIEELLEGLRHSAAEIAPRFLANMPPAYFQDTDQDVGPMALDNLLWYRGQHPFYKKNKPRHRCRTVFY